LATVNNPSTLKNPAPSQPFRNPVLPLARRPAALLAFPKLHYNPSVRSLSRSPLYAPLSLSLCLLSLPSGPAQQAPPASGARILLMPRNLITGERATLAVLDVNGRLTPRVNVNFSDGEQVTTDDTGRALFVAPLHPGTFTAGIEGRTGRVSSRVSNPESLPATFEMVTAAPRFASISDRFELAGRGFCGDADANRVTISGMPGLVLASSPASLAVLPPSVMDLGPAQVKVSCGQKVADPFTIVFVVLELEAKTGILSPGEHRDLVVRVRGSTAKVNLEARNIMPEVADLEGGATVRAESSGGASNVAKFQLAGKKHGNFTISIRLIAPLSSPRP